MQPLPPAGRERERERERESLRESSFTGEGNRAPVAKATRDMEEGGASAYARFEREESVPFNFLQLDNCAFLRIARCGAASLAVAILSLPLLTPGIIIKSLTDFVPLYAVGCLMSAIELPFCCGFIGPCRRIQGCLRPIEIYWLRGTVYVLLAGVLTLVNIFITAHLDISLTLASCALLVVGTFYILAFCNGERSGRESEQALESPAETGGAMAWMRNLIPGRQNAADDIQRAALRAAMSTAM